MASHDQTAVEAGIKNGSLEALKSPFQLDTSGMMHAGTSALASSQRDTLLVGPSRLYSGGTEAFSDKDKDDYLLKLLSKGAMPSKAPGKEFRAPDPPKSDKRCVYSRGTVGLLSHTKCSTPANPHSGAVQTLAADKTFVGDVEAGTLEVKAKNASLLARTNAKAADLSISNTRQRLGDDVTDKFRASILQHQVTFLEQLYDLHRSIAIQRLLVKNCPEVQTVMSEAVKLVQAAEGRLNEKERRAGKRQKTSSDDLRPDSQFAAVPQHFDGAITDGDDSGKDGDGTGGSGNGSGGGSNSPQPGVPLTQHYMPPFMNGAFPGLNPGAPTPSGASASPAVMNPTVGVVGPPHYWGAGPGSYSMNAFPYPALPQDPMAWWYQNYYGGGRQPMQPPAAMVPEEASVPPIMRPGGTNQARWWLDPRQTFGPPADLDIVNKVQPTRVVGEVESAPPNAAAAQPSPSLFGNRGRKRKPADEFDEASSGTTAPEHGAIPGRTAMEGGTPRGSSRARARQINSNGLDENAAELLLSMSGKPAVGHDLS